MRCSPASVTTSGSPPPGSCSTPRPVEPAQYTAIAFTEALAEAGIAPSIGTVGDALDNALIESTIGLYKTELIERHPQGRSWSGAGEVERETAGYVHWFNTDRLHTSIHMLAPIDYENLYPLQPPRPVFAV